jgi:hypothetical protein
VIGDLILIHLKVLAKQASYEPPHEPWRSQMPLDSILVVIAVVMMFATFAVVLGWGERKARKL